MHKSRRITSKRHSHLSVVQDVTEVTDDVGLFDDLFSALFKLGRYAVAPTGMPAHLWQNGFKVTPTSHRI